MRPLEGLLVLDFSQFLAGPSAAMRLADLGARVIKIERPGGGDLCRQLYISNLELDGDSTLFHSINRNKQSFAADLKNPKDFAAVRKLVERADVLIQNFRPGVMEKIGMHYDAVQGWNPRLVYGSITGYGKEGPWRDKPGQDLLAQAMSGTAWLSGDSTQGPVPMGLSVADMFTAAHLVQGLLACLVRRGVTGKGGLVEVSLMESILDLQFEVITTHLNDGGQLPQRSAVNNAHAYLGAPYGIYQTTDGYLAMAMGSVLRLGELLSCPPLSTYTDPKSWFTRRDEIKAELARHLKTQTTAHWLGILEPADIWCADVLTWTRLMQHDGFKVLKMTQQVSRGNGVSLLTTRCPIRVDGGILLSPLGAPKIGEHNAAVEKEFLGVKILDTHQHLLYPARFQYSWADGIPALANQPFRLEEYLTAANNTGITDTLFMEVAVDDPHLKEETDFFLELAGKLGTGIVGVIATARPEKEDFPAYLDSILHPRLKGIRRILHTEPDAVSQSALFAKNIARLAKHRLTCDLCLLPRQLHLGANLLRQAPDVQFILDHCGIPNIKDAELDPWRDRIRELAQFPNLACKVSGVVAYCHPDRVNAQSIRPFVEHCFECFGPDRVLFGGDWPVCNLTSSLGRWVEIAKELVAAESAETRENFFFRNAERIYGLNS